MYRGEKPLETKLAPTWTLEDVARHAVDFWLSTEDLPRPENRVTLDARRQHRSSATRRPTTSRSSGSTTSSSRLLEHTRACTTTTCSRATPTSRTTSRSPACAHQAGTCRFGTDPATSVLDADCRAHELDNLYVVDTSFFPSIGAVNPALTAMANALRVGDHLLERMGAPQARQEPAACRIELHVVVVGGGFAGVGCARRLARHDDVRVTLIDRNNYHQFQPLLYQVATSQLAPSDVAFSLRKLFARPSERRRQARPRWRRVDPATRTVTTTDGDRFAGDAIVLAAGSQPNFFRTPGADAARLPAVLPRRRAAAAIAHHRRLRGRRPRPGAGRPGRAELRRRRRRPDRRRDGRRARRPDPRDDGRRVPRPRGHGGARSTSSTSATRCSGRSPTRRTTTSPRSWGARACGCTSAPRSPTSARAT